MKDLTPNLSEMYQTDVGVGKGNRQRERDVSGEKCCEGGRWKGKRRVIENTEHLFSLAIDYFRLILQMFH
jgi:hypothetical protein